jgi:hypothetical protein
MDDLSVEELASNLSTYRDQLREVSLPSSRHLRIQSPFCFRSDFSLYVAMAVVSRSVFRCYGQNFGALASWVSDAVYPGIRFWMWR